MPRIQPSSMTDKVGRITPVRAVTASVVPMNLSGSQNLANQRWKILPRPSKGRGAGVWGETAYAVGNKHLSLKSTTDQNPRHPPDSRAKSAGQIGYKNGIHNSEGERSLSVRFVSLKCFPGGFDTKNIFHP